MEMNPKELVKVLLYCGNGGDCDSCCHPCHGEHGEFEWRCLGPLLLHAASQIERDQKEFAELREENERLKTYEDSGLSPEDAANLHAILRLGDGMTLMRLRELAVADQEGRVIVLPCKVGDTVYFALLGRIIEKQVFSIVSFSNSTRIYCDGTSEYFRPEDIGKTFFLAREGAEKALREMEGKKDG